MTRWFENRFESSTGVHSHPAIRESGLSLATSKHGVATASRSGFAGSGRAGPRAISNAERALRSDADAGERGRSPATG